MHAIAPLQTASVWPALGFQGTTEEATEGLLSGMHLHLPISPVTPFGPSCYYQFHFSGKELSHRAVKKLAKITPLIRIK
jgi:hypothetical protein